LLQPGKDPRAALRALCGIAEGRDTVAGIGESLVQALGASVEGLRGFPQLSGAGIDVPSTPSALWIWARGEDRGELLHRSRRIERTLERAFQVERIVDGFRYDVGRDLTGYEDGTENPKGAKARAAALVKGGNRLAGSSFAAVQQWVHRFDRFDAMTGREQDNAVGRRRADNVELGHAPRSAHVKRTAQEDFEPEAFVVRRSMPWVEAAAAGLMFVAFGATLGSFEVQLRRMLGFDDGVVDALFKFTCPVSGAYYWCPPLLRGRLDLRAIGL
jgi:putative iron-dependent peroxidase